MEAIQRNLYIILQKNDYFKNLNQKNRELLSGICLPRQTDKRDVIFREGEKGHALYLCARGTIQLFKTSADGQEVVIKIAGPGELFGEVVLFEKEKYPVTAVALEKSLGYILPKAQFHCLLENREFREEFISILMTKMRYLAEQIQFLTVHEV
jgi:CRP/FNR family transcriptional regulator